MATLTLYETADSYTPQGELRCEATRSMALIVTNNPVMAQFAIASPPGLKAAAYPFLAEERRMLPGAWGWTEVDFQGSPIVGVRVRSAMSGKPGFVTVHA